MYKESFKFIKNKKVLGNVFGFTLIEMMIVISIISIFSSMTVINFRANEKSKELDNQALILLDGIKKTQTSALAGKLIDDELPVAYRIEVAPCLSNCSFDLKIEPLGESLYTLETSELSKSKISIVDENVNDIDKVLNINISPFRGKMSMFFNGAPTNVASIRLEHIDDSSISKLITINAISGRIDISN